MKKITLIVLSLLFSIFSISQNCTSNTEHNSYPALNDGSIEQVTTTIEPGEYMTLTNILANDYTFTANHTVSMVEQNDYITISNTSNMILAQGVSPLPYTFASSGSYRIHVSLNSNCDTDMVNVTITLLNETVAPSTCQEPENPTVSYRSDTRIDFSWDPPSIGSTPISYDWEAVPDGSSQGDGGNPSGNVLTTMASATGLTPNTDYDFYIRSDCGGNGISNWIGPLPLSTNAGAPPENDICSGANLIVEETNVPNAASATAMNETLLNTAQTDVVPENCDSGNTDNARDDVWYSFIAQTTDINITLNPKFNGILSLFSDCDQSSLLDCSDVGTGTTEEQIIYNSLVIGQTYYFRVWSQGFAASNPNFTVKLWSPTVVADADSDGYSDPTDCDDGNPNINPSATEICDGVDNDCDGDIDDADSSITGQTTWYADTDGDGFGDPNVILVSCNQPTDYVADNTDCDDNEAASYPGNTEICDGIDNDCDGDIDDDDASIDTSTQTMYYIDFDGDGYGDENDSGTLFCTPSGGYVSDNTDCDDNDFDVNPGKVEIQGNGKDDDCNPATDDTLGVDDFNYENIRILPNPFRDVLSIHLPNSLNNENFKINFFDLNGRLVFKNSEPSINGIINIRNLEGLQSGIYFLKISTTVYAKSVVKRLIKD